jgi:hypothetical protein
MLWVFLRDEMVYLPDGATVLSKQGTSYVHDNDGRVLARYDSHSVLVFTRNEQVALLLKGAIEASAHLPQGKPSD